jgi:hypothetical protein
MCGLCTWTSVDGTVCFSRSGGEQNEMYFCDQKSLSMQTLRMTFEAKRQLCDILVNVGFPEECMTPLVFNFNGPDRNLDMVKNLVKLHSTVFYLGDCVIEFLWYCRKSIYF